MEFMVEYRVTWWQPPIGEGEGHDEMWHYPTIREATTRAGVELANGIEQVVITRV